MFVFTTKTRYGLRALLYLAKKGRIVSLKEIAQKEKIPLPYLEKIFSLLKKAKIVKAKRGVKGGYLLAKPRGEIKLKEIIVALEGKKPTIACLNGSSCWREKECPARYFWKKLYSQLEELLEKTTIEEFIN